MSLSPFSRYRLYRNPFGELTVAERVELAVVEADSLADWLLSPPSKHKLLQVHGPCGHGKSTNLLAVQHALRLRGLKAPYVYFPEEGNQPRLPASRPLLVDEAQRTGWRRRRELLRSGGPLVMGTHEDFTHIFQQAGFEVMSLDLAQPLPAHRLQDILNRRILASQENGSRTNAWHPLCLSLGQVVALQGRFGSNIRLIEQYLYVAFQDFAEKGEPWLPVS